jgi:hypothetical protein
MRILIIFLLIIPLSSISQETSTIPYIQNDNFASNAFGFKATIGNFQKHYGSFLLIIKNTFEND